MKDLKWVINKFVKKGWCCVDVGANIGEFSQKMLNKIGDTGSLWMFEPSPQSNYVLFPRFCKDENAHGFDLALSDSNTVTTFYVDMRNQMGGVASSLFSHDFFEEVKEIQVTVTTLDDFVAKYQISPDFIKIDAEGADAKVILGGKDFILKEKPLLFFECSAVHWVNDYDKVFDLLKGYYWIVRMESGEIVNEMGPDYRENEMSDYFALPKKKSTLANFVYKRKISKWFNPRYDLRKGL